MSIQTISDSDLRNLFEVQQAGIDKHRLDIKMEMEVQLETAVEIKRRYAPAAKPDPEPAPHGD